MDERYRQKIVEVYNNEVPPEIQRQREQSKKRRRDLCEKAMVLKLADGMENGIESLPSKVDEVLIGETYTSGLFATRFIKKGDVVAEYGGKLIFADSLLETNINPDARLLMSDDEFKAAVNARIAELQARRDSSVGIVQGKPVVLLDHYNDEGVEERFSTRRMLGRFANSAVGRYDVDANCKLVVTFHKRKEYGETAFKVGEVGAVYVRVQVVAIADIDATRECVVSYGAGYFRY